jgi:hypothetical protein
MIATTSHTTELLDLLRELRPIAETHIPSTVRVIDQHIAKLKLLAHRETCDGCQSYYEGEWRTHYEQRPPGTLSAVYDSQECRVMTCRVCARYGLEYVPFTRRGVHGYSYRAFAVCLDCGHATEI